VQALEEPRRVAVAPQDRLDKDRRERQGAALTPPRLDGHGVDLAGRQRAPRRVVRVVQRPSAQGRARPRPLTEPDLFLDVVLEREPTRPRRVRAEVEGARLRRRRVNVNEPLHASNVRHAPATVSGIDSAP